MGVNFALFSAHATKVELCLFDNTGERELHRIELPEFTDEVWRGYLPDAEPVTVYGYRVHGPYAPDAGHRFNPHKLVLDPYAKALVGSLRRAPELFGYTLGAPNDDLSYDERDSAPLMPKCRVVDPAFTWGRNRAPATQWNRTIIYEAHVRGFTRLYPLVPQELRGTFAGLTTEVVIDYLRTLGVTAFELSRCMLSSTTVCCLTRGSKNYWGYDTIGFFASHLHYSSRGSTREFKEMVARLHDAGLEVILDVVYNHTAEGNEHGPTLSFRGIDNASYYRLLPDKPRYYITDTGSGSTVNLSHPQVLQMVTDSLRYWATEMRVDGFRFDLATILGREPYGFDQGGGFLDSCRQDPSLSRVKLIAEPWDCGPGGYQVGGFPPGWAEWNDRYRDTVRRYWKGDPEQAPQLASRLAASADFFDVRDRKLWASINFITAHDRFTLNDLVSYSDKHNEGTPNNNSWGISLFGIYWPLTKHPDIPFERYADDVISHCRSEAQALRLRQALEQRLAECQLQLHPQNTKVVYCNDANRPRKYPTRRFDFLGYTFRPRSAQNRDGKRFVSFLPAVSNKAAKRMRQSVRPWRLHRRNDLGREEIAAWVRPILSGWVRYYGRF